MIEFKFVREFIPKGHPVIYEKSFTECRTNQDMLIGEIIRCLLKECNLSVTD